MRHDAAAGSYLMAAQADLHADPRTVWRTLTDYEHLPEFIPGIRSVRVAERHAGGGGEDLVVEERGDARFLVFGQPIRIRMDVHQEEPRVVRARAIPWPDAPDPPPGELEPESFSASYVLEPIEDGVRIVYRARIVPRAPWPAMIERLALRENASKQFGALLVEIARRERGARSAGGEAAGATAAGGEAPAAAQ